MRRTQRLCVWQWMIVLTVTSATLGVGQLYGQTGRGIGADTGTLIAPPMLRMWNWPDTVFLTGAYGTAELLTPSGKAADIWDFLDAMGLSLYVTHLYHEPNNMTDSLRWLRYIDTLSWSADVVSGHRFTVYDAGVLTDQMGQGRAVEFYLFDSVQSVWFPFRFMERQGGETDTNATIVVDGRKLLEQVYKTSNTTPGTVIAEHIAFNQWDEDARKIYRWKTMAGEDSVQVVDRWYHDDASRGDPQGGPKIDTVYYVVVAGHLFEGGTSLDTDSLLKIDIIYEVPQGAKFHPGANTTTQTAPTDTTFPVTTLYVTKNDLKPKGNDVFDKYQEAIFPIDLRYLANGAWGPTKDTSDCSRRFDIRVTWLGGEQLAVRSISLRDIHGQLSLGTDSAARAWRQERIHTTIVPFVLSSRGKNISLGR